jgi:hypothetical protein
MLEFLPDNQKENLKKISSIDSSKITKDHLLKLKSVNGKLVVVRQDSVYNQISSSPKLQSVTDSTGVCIKNNIYGTTYFDPGTYLTGINLPSTDKTIVNLAGKTRIRVVETKETLIQHLKEGQELPSRLVSNDWTLLILLVAAFLISLVRDASKGFKPVLDFFLFRGIKGHDSRDNDLFHWQSTVQNLISFFIISLFIYKIASYNNLVPDGFNGLIVWVACLALVIILLTLRHLVCTITGNLSGQRDAFTEYLSGIYQSYHYVAVIYFFLVIFISYSNILPSDIFIIAGFASFALIYLFRIVRLLIIFLNRGISIFYLILYLCALEILPVAITIRYFAGTARIG